MILQTLFYEINAKTAYFIREWFLLSSFGEMCFLEEIYKKKKKKKKKSNFEIFEIGVLQPIYVIVTSP